MQVPTGVRQLMVVCSDAKTKSLIGAMVEAWQDVLDYLQGRVSGYQLGAGLARSMRSEVD